MSLPCADAKSNALATKAVQLNQGINDTLALVGIEDFVIRSSYSLPKGNHCKGRALCERNIVHEPGTVDGFVCEYRPPIYQERSYGWRRFRYPRR
jgi:hypothetical protein